MQSSIWVNLAICWTILWGLVLVGPPLLEKIVVIARGNETVKGVAEGLSETCCADSVRFVALPIWGAGIFLLVAGAIVAAKRARR